MVLEQRRDQVELFKYGRIRSILPSSVSARLILVDRSNPGGAVLWTKIAAPLSDARNDKK